MSPEGKVKARLKGLLDEWACYYFMPVQTGYGKQGVDFFICARTVITQEMVGQTIGRFIAAETKKVGVTKPTKRQGDTLKSVKEAAGESYVVTMDERDNLVWLKQ